MNIQKNFWINNFEEGYYDKVIISGLLRKRGIQSNWHNLVYKKIKTYIDPNDQHLDYACGSGTFIGNYLYDNSLGVDLSPIQIEYAKKNYHNNQFIKIEDFNEYHDEKFDKITILGLLEFLPNDETVKLLKFLKSKLKEGGRIIISTPNFTSLFHLVEYFSKKIGLNDYSEVQNSKLNVTELKKIIKDSGLENFKITKIINIGIFSSILSHRLGEFLNNLLNKITFNKFGFILIAEIY